MFRKILIITALILGSLVLLTSGAAAVLYFTHAGEYIVPATTTDNPALPAVELEGNRFHAEIFGNPGNPVAIVLHRGPGGDYRSIMPPPPWLMNTLSSFTIREEAASLRG